MQDIIRDLTSLSFPLVNMSTVGSYKPDIEKGGWSVDCRTRLMEFSFQNKNSNICRTGLAPCLTLWLVLAEKPLQVSVFPPRKCPVRSVNRRLNNDNKNKWIITTEHSENYISIVFKITLMTITYKIYWTASGHRICFLINHDREFDKLYLSYIKKIFRENKNYFEAKKTYLR